MKKNRNRSVKNSFEFPARFLESLPDVETIQSNRKTSETGASQIVKDKEFKQKRGDTFSYDRDSLTNESDLDIVSFGKSSSSSISWNDEFDTEATKRVQQEFERMERVLQGKEPIPLHYNKDEYKQWINTFPQLSVIGNKIGHSSIDEKNSNTNFEEVIAHHSDDYFTSGDIVLSSADLKKISYIKNQAVEDVFRKVSNKLISTSRIKNEATNTKFIEHKSSKLYTPKTNNFLKVSPLLSKETPVKTPILNKREQSSSSVSKSEKLSKWMNESSNKYSSLPYIKCAKNKANRPSLRKKSSGNSRYSTNASPYRSTCVSLPPIKTSNLPPVNKFRSISTTPRNPTKTIISASIPVQGKIKKNNKCNFEISKSDQGRT